MNMYIWMFILPEEESECEERQVIVCSLEASEARDDDHSDEEFLDVLNHDVNSIYNVQLNMIILIKNMPLKNYWGKGEGSIDFCIIFLD